MFRVKVPERLICHLSQHFQSHLFCNTHHVHIVVVIAEFLEYSISGDFRQERKPRTSARSRRGCVPTRLWSRRFILFDCVKGLRPPRHKIGHFRDVLPSQSLGLLTERRNLTRQKQTCIRNKIYYNTDKINTKIKPCLVASYDLRPGNEKRAYS